MKHFRVFRILLYLLLILSAAAACVAVWRFTRDWRAVLTAGALFCAAILTAAGLERVRENQDRALFTALSDLVADISAGCFNPVFPELDDGLLSKLQNQLLRLMETMQNQNALLEKERNEIKSLISDISHQLKTPVATLKLYGEYLLDDTAVQEERLKYLAAFSAALDRLTFLTDSLIKLSRLEGGVIALNPVPASLNETTLAAVMQAYEKAVKKNVEIVFDSDRLNITLPHDIKWTAEALFNLIDNAVKYCEAGTKVTIGFARYEMFARVDVTDTGSDIPENELGGIFGRFYRGSNAKDVEGAGIGLFLARKIITDQGGYIKVKSGSGTTMFSVFLPVNTNS